MENIISLQTGDTQELLTLFAECFRDDSYYADYFGGGDFREKMIEAFTPQIRRIVERGHCYGIRYKGRLAAFLINLEYDKLEREDSALFRDIFTTAGTAQARADAARFREAALQLGRNVMYLQSVGVAPEARNRGYASALVDHLLETYPFHSVIVDVSNESTLPIYRHRGFEISELSAGYYLVQMARSFRTALLAVPEVNDLRNMGLRFETVCERNIIGYTGYTVRYHTEETYPAGCALNPLPSLTLFAAAEGQAADTDATVVRLPRDDFFQYQRTINVAVMTERRPFRMAEDADGRIALFENKENEDAEGTGELVYLYFLCPEKKNAADPAAGQPPSHQEKPPVVNPKLFAMVQTRTKEWAVIPDVFVMIPVQMPGEIGDRSAMPAEKSAAARLLEHLRFRTSYEAGVPTKEKAVDDLSGFKDRILRHYLGRIRIQLRAELEHYSFDTYGEQIGATAEADLFVTEDLRSECAVLTLYSPSSPFLLSYFLDAVVRNQLIVEDGEEEPNFYEYIHRKYRMVKRGTPKSFVMIPKSRFCLEETQIASLLFSETVYEDGEKMGTILDPALMDIVRSPYGMGQYNRGFVCAHTNVVLHFLPDISCSVEKRIEEEAVTLFYIELILLEEAAIHIADQAIITLFGNEKSTDPILFLEEVDRIQDDFSKTIDFWDIQVNFPSSQQSINMLRKAFQLREQFEMMQRNRDQLQIVQANKNDIVDRKGAERMGTSLALISLLAVLSAWVDGHGYIQALVEEAWIGSETGALFKRVVFWVVLAVLCFAVVKITGLWDRVRRRLQRNRN